MTMPADDDRAHEPADLELREPGRARLRLLARSLPQEAFAGDAPNGPLDVEGALARVLARAAQERATQAPLAQPLSQGAGPPVRAARALAERAARARELAAPRRVPGLRRSTLIGAAMLLASLAGPWMVRTRAEEPRPTTVPTAWLAGVSSTSAVVFWSQR
ncbi:MAG: hypothetical protein AB7N76_25745 [Planctomycetota bacterium]